MSLANILPNTAILKAPSNWALILFSMAILAFVFHLLFKDAN